MNPQRFFKRVQIGLLVVVLVKMPEKISSSFAGKRKSSFHELKHGKGSLKRLSRILGDLNDWTIEENEEYSQGEVQIEHAHCHRKKIWKVWWDNMIHFDLFRHSKRNKLCTCLFIVESPQWYSQYVMTFVMAIEVLQTFVLISNMPLNILILSSEVLFPLYLAMVCTLLLISMMIPLFHGRVNQAIARPAISLYFHLQSRLLYTPICYAFIHKFMFFRFGNDEIDWIYGILCLWLFLWFQWLVLYIQYNFYESDFFYTQSRFRTPCKGLFSVYASAYKLNAVLFALVAHGIPNLGIPITFLILSANGILIQRKPFYSSSVNRLMTTISLYLSFCSVVVFLDNMYGGHTVPPALLLIPMLFLYPVYAHLPSPKKPFPGSRWVDAMIGIDLSPAYVYMFSLTSLISSPTFLGNLAFYFEKVCLDYNSALMFYDLAMHREPLHLSNMGRYASFLWHVMGNQALAFRVIEAAIEMPNASRDIWCLHGYFSCQTGKPFSTYEKSYSKSAALGMGHVLYQQLYSDATTSTCIFLLESDGGTCIDCNGTTLFCFGATTIHQFCHTSIPFFVHNSPLKQQNGKMSQLLAEEYLQKCSEDGIEFEWTFRRSIGGLFTVNVRLEYANHGRWILGKFYNYSELVECQQASSTFQAILSISSDPLLVMNAEGAIVDMNDVASNLSDLSRVVEAIQRVVACQEIQKIYIEDFHVIIQEVDQTDTRMFLCRFIPSDKPKISKRSLILKSIRKYSDCFSSPIVVLNVDSGLVLDMNLAAQSIFDFDKSKAQARKSYAYSFLPGFSSQIQKFYGTRPQEPQIKISSGRWAKAIKAARKQTPKSGNFNTIADVIASVVKAQYGPGVRIETGVPFKSYDGKCFHATMRCEEFLVYDEPLLLMQLSSVVFDDH